LILSIETKSEILQYIRIRENIYIVLVRSGKIYAEWENI
jgi:hypothetical protein